MTTLNGCIVTIRAKRKKCRMNVIHLILTILILVVKASSSFRIGAFNLKVFGRTKASDTKVISYIVKVCHFPPFIYMEQLHV